MCRTNSDTMFFFEKTMRHTIGMAFILFIVLLLS